VSSRTARTIQRNPVSRKKEKKRKEKKRKEKKEGRKEKRKAQPCPSFLPLFSCEF
jgi:hypothetical protein